MSQQTKQEIRYAVGQIAFLMKGPGGETLCIPARHVGKPCVIAQPGLIRMLSDGSEWLQNSMQHLMLAFPRVGDEVMCEGICRAVVRIDHDDMAVDNAPQPLFLSGERHTWPTFEELSLPSGEHDPDLALLPAADEPQGEPEVKFAVGDRVRTEDGDGTVTRVDEDDEDFITAITEVAAALEDWYYTRTPVKYSPTSEDLPGTLEFLKADYHQRNYAALRVWTGGTDTSIYARIGKPSVNLIFRLHHDLLHIKLDAGMDLYGELAVAWFGLEEFPELSSDAKLLYIINTAGQTLLHYLTGKHLDDPYAFVSWIWHYMRDYGPHRETTLQDLQDAVRLYHNVTSVPVHVTGGC